MISVPKDPHDSPYFLTSNGYGFRLYDPDRDEAQVCSLCWSNSLPGGRPFPLIPEAGALSFGRVVTGPFASCAGEYFYVVDELSSGKPVAYLTGAEGDAVDTGKGKVSWLRWRDAMCERIAEGEFGEISPMIYLPVTGYLQSRKLLYTLSLGPRAVQFLLHAKLNNQREMPEIPDCPEFHFHVAAGHRGKGIGRKLIRCFLQRLPDRKPHRVCAQVTVCEGGKTLGYYLQMSYRGKKLWQVHDRRETAMYTTREKKRWGLGSKVENVSLVADRKRLLGFVGGRR